MVEKCVGSEIGKSPEIRTFMGDASLVLQNDFIGIEIEAEGLIQIPELPFSSYWENHNDNSLRQEVDRETGNTLYSNEFVLKYPLCGRDLVQALREFKSIMEQTPRSSQETDRTSVHIHLDVRDLSVREFYKFIIVYCVFERVLFKFCGIDRENNNFCLPFYTTEGKIFENISEITTKSLGQFSRRLSADYRYSALNLCALLKFGSVEFRHCRGTYDIDFIQRWINIIFKLKEYARKKNEYSLHNFPTYISDKGYLPILVEVFGEYAPALQDKENKQDILLGIRQAQKILYSETLEKVNKQFMFSLWDKQNNSPIAEYMVKKGLFPIKNSSEKKLREVDRGGQSFIPETPVESDGTLAEPNTLRPTGGRMR